METIKCYLDEMKPEHLRQYMYGDAKEMPLPKSDKWVSGLRPCGEVGSNPKDEYGSHKIPLGLVSPTASVLQALCMQDGAEKYGPYNFRVAKVQALTYLEAALRHILVLMDGEDFDAGTGKPHIGYALATLQIYADAWINNFLIDNRPVQGSAGMLMSLLTRAPGDTDFTGAEIRSKINYVINVNKGVYKAFDAPGATTDKVQVGKGANNIIEPSTGESWTPVEIIKSRRHGKVVREFKWSMPAGPGKPNKRRTTKKVTKRRKPRTTGL